MYTVGLPAVNVNARLSLFEIACDLIIIEIFVIKEMVHEIFVLNPLLVYEIQFFFGGGGRGQNPFDPHLAATIKMTSY